MWTVPYVIPLRSNNLYSSLKVWCNKVRRTQTDVRPRSTRIHRTKQKVVGNRIVRSPAVWKADFSLWSDVTVSIIMICSSLIMHTISWLRVNSRCWDVEASSEDSLHTDVTRFSVMTLCSLVWWLLVFRRNLLPPFRRRNTRSVGEYPDHFLGFPLSIWECCDSIVKQTVEGFSKYILASSLHRASLNNLTVKSWWV